MSDQPTGDSKRRDQKEIRADQAKTAKEQRQARRQARREAEKQNAKSADGGGTIRVATVVMAVAAVITFVIVIVPQRASLRASKVETNLFAEQPVPILFTITVHNDGQLTANLNTLCARFVNVDDVKQWPKKPKVPASGCKAMQGVIAGNQDGVFDSHLDNSQGKRLLVNPDLSKQMQTGIRPAYLFGWVTYRDAYSPFINPFDVFGVAQANFCTKYRPDIKEWVDCDIPGYG